VLMDLRMPELDGVSAILALAQRGVGARVLVLTTYDTDTDVLPAIEAGATGYLLKDSPPDELLRGVRAAARGEAVLSPSVATRLLGQVRQPARDPLSQRELDILGLIAQGCSNREAAGRLFISEATVKTHLLHIYAKLGVNDRAAAVAAGFERGLLPRPLRSPNKVRGSAVGASRCTAVVKATVRGWPAQYAGRPSNVKGRFAFPFGNDLRPPLTTEPNAPPPVRNRGQAGACPDRTRAVPWTVRAGHKGRSGTGEGSQVSCTTPPPRRGSSRRRSRGRYAFPRTGRGD